MALLSFEKYCSPKTTAELRLIAALSCRNLEGDWLNPPLDLEHAEFFLSNVLIELEKALRKHNAVKVIKEKARVFFRIIGAATGDTRELCGFELIHKQTNTTKTIMSTLQEIRLDRIEVIGNYREVQPPSETDPDMIELAESVRRDGVFQSILVRPHPTKPGFFQLIFGHRRHLASTMAGLQTIPANVKDIRDEDILEIQVVENMQRKDVHPMDEGLAFKSLIDSKGWSVVEVGERFGKKEYYVRQRLRLTDLSKAWQHVFFKGAIFLTDAVKVAALSPADQKDLYDEEVDKDDLKKPDFKVALEAWDFDKYKGDLSNAAFDIADPLLDKKMGACISCKYNSGTALLFLEAVGSSRCSNTGCFKNKTEKSFVQRVESALEDVGMLFVLTDHGDHKKDVAELVKTYSIEVLSYSSINELCAPEKPDREEWEADTEGDFGTEKEKKKAWEKKISDYGDALKNYEKKIDSGRYKKALVVAGADKGKIIYLQLAKKTYGSPQSTKSVADVKEAIASGEATLDDIKAEIARIGVNLDNATALDEEKVHVRIMEDYKKVVTESPDISNSLTTAEWTCLNWYLLDKSGILNGHDADDLQKIFGLEDCSLDDRDTREEIWQKIEKMDDNQLATIFRFLMAKEYAAASTRLYQWDKAFVMRKMAENIESIPIAQYEAEQQEKADKRLKTASKRLNELKAKEKELTPTKKAATKPDANASKLPRKKKAAPQMNHLGQELTDYGLTGPSLNELADENTPAEE